MHEDNEQNSQSKEHFMRLALAQAHHALPACRPNPPVGCVVVRGGQVISTGYTQPPGAPHAEAMAMAGVSGSGHDLVVFTTLEPCSFEGRTPSCAHTLVQWGVGTVIVGMLDPHPRNRGAGLRILQQAGVRTECGVLAAEVASFLDPYLIRD